ncbi:zinc finger BED domain-containing protein RICESLEEPER 1-like [Tasmannia lanceolata]|uniref:zinc finger BED domain-containing protein RICESLEEPER 1-like n=1 Tax=Tasmannia lanceolata TaxID=3420 RepID=UPI0040630497
MARRMKDKYDKYWGDIEKMNKLIYIAVVLDPRHKMEFVKFALISMYGEGKGNELGEKVFHARVELFNEWNNTNTVNTSRDNQVNLGQSTSRELSQEPREHVRKMIKEKFKKHKIEAGGGDNKSELERYLSEDIEEGPDEFDILGWWKVNSCRFPILSEMAQNVLAVPISTIASESTFSTGGVYLMHLGVL